MSFFGVGNPFSTVVGQKIEQATDGLLPSENWALNMEICDMINGNPEASKDAIKAIRKRLTQSAGKNYTVVMYTLTVLETCVKNCGKAFHVQVCNKEFISELVKLIGPKNDPPTVVQDKVLNLIQCWADAFQNQPELQGVGQVYNELKTKGVEFPMTDLDAMAPIFTPQRSVADGSDRVDGAGSPRAVSPRPSNAAESQPVLGAVPLAPLTPSQVSKLRADLLVVEGNMSVMNDMLNEMTAQAPEQHHPSDVELLDEVAATVRAMQQRVAVLAGAACAAAGPGPAGAAPHVLAADLLAVNDQLHHLLLRYKRFSSNRLAATGGATPSAILGAAMGVPSAAKNNGDDALIDLSDDVPDIAKLSVNNEPGNKSPTGSKDEFDMFAQSRNVTYDNSKTSGSSYAAGMEQQSAGLAAAAAARQPLPTGMDQREIDEIAAWLEQEKSSSEATANNAQESVTSSDFEKFLAERAAAADNLPNVNENRDQNTPQATPRHRQIKKEDDSMFAL